MLAKFHCGQRTVFERNFDGFKYLVTEGEDDLGLFTDFAEAVRCAMGPRPTAQTEGLAWYTIALEQRRGVIDAHDKLSAALAANERLRDAVALTWSDTPPSLDDVGSDDLVVYATTDTCSTRYYVMPGGDWLPHGRTGKKRLYAVIPAPVLDSAQIDGT